MTSHSITPEPVDAVDQDQANAEQPQKRTAMDRVLGGIEHVGNKLPEPFTLFLWLFLITAVISTIMAWMGKEVQIPGEDETVK